MAATVCQLLHALGAIRPVLDGCYRVSTVPCTGRETAGVYLDGCYRVSTVPCTGRKTAGVYLDGCYRVSTVPCTGRETAGVRWLLSCVICSMCWARDGRCYLDGCYRVTTFCAVGFRDLLPYS